MDEIVRQIREWSNKLKDLPPLPRIIAVHSVPYGKVYRQWDTKGELWIWINRGFVMDLPWRTKTSGAIFDTDMTYDLTGMPIYYDHPYWRKNEGV